VKDTPGDSLGLTATLDFQLLRSVVDAGYDMSDPVGLGALLPIVGEQIRALQVASTEIKTAQLHMSEREDRISRLKDTCERLRGVAPLTLTRECAAVIRTAEKLLRYMKSLLPLIPTDRFEMPSQASFILRNSITGLDRVRWVLIDKAKWKSYDTAWERFEERVRVLSDRLLGYDANLEEFPVKGLDQDFPPKYSPVSDDEDFAILAKDLAEWHLALAAMPV